MFLGEDRWILSLFLLISPFCFGILCTSFFTEKLPNLTYGLNQIFEILLWNILHIIFSRLPFCFGIPLHIILKGAWVGGEPIRIEYLRASVFLLVQKMMCTKIPKQTRNLRCFALEFWCTSFLDQSERGGSTNQLRHFQNLDQ